MEVDPPRPPDPPDPTSYTPSSTKRHLDADNQPPAKKTITSVDQATPSIETVYTDSILVIGGLSYTTLDKGPYVVHVSRTETDPAAGTTIKPIRFGQFLKHNKISNVCYDGVKKVGRNKISVEFTSADDANKFVTLPILAMCKYTAFIPTYNVTRIGIVRQVPTDMSMTEFVESLELPSGCGKVLKARRLSRKNILDDKTTWVPTQTVVVTFQGQVLPSRVFSYYTSLPVELYTYPTIQCHACCKFGHTKLQCRSKPRCFRCSKEHFGDSCEINENESTCLHCSGRHFATDKNCPELERQKSIKAVMAQSSVSYEEAASQIPKVVQSYAEVAQKDPSLPLVSRRTSEPSNSPQSQPRQTYAKTVYAIQRQRPKAPLGKSYDKAAHNEIIAEPISQMQNGCALANNHILKSSPPSENMLEILISLIINLITTNPLPLPSNVANKLTQLVSLSSSQHGSSVHNAVEHPEHATKEA